MTPTSDKPDLRRIGEEAFVEVLGLLLSLPVSLRNLSDADSARGVPEQITSTVQLAGPRFSARVHLHLPTPFVVHAVGLLTGLDGAAREADALLDDTAGEIANMVAGRVAAHLAVQGYPAALGTPSISRGAGLPIPTRPEEGHEQTEVFCDGHRLLLELQYGYGTP